MLHVCSPDFSLLAPQPLPQQMHRILLCSAMLISGGVLQPPYTPCLPHIQWLKPVTHLFTQTFLKGLARPELHGRPGQDLTMSMCWWSTDVLGMGGTHMLQARQADGSYETLHLDDRCPRTASHTLPHEFVRCILHCTAQDMK